MKKLAIVLGVLSLFLLGMGASLKHGNEVAKDDIFYMVSHSEYWSGEQGQVIARLYNWQGDPITVTNCTVDIYYPGNKSKFVDNALTDDSLQTTTGTHFYKFTTPSIEGVYQYVVTCNYPQNKQSSSASSFHVNPALNTIDVLNDTLNTLSADELSHYNDMQSNFTVVINNQATMITNQGDILLNLTDVLANQDVLTANQDTMLLNLTSIHDDTSYIRENMLTETVFMQNISEVVANQQTIIGKEDELLTDLDNVQDFCNNPETSGSVLCQWVNETRLRVIDLNNTLSLSYENYLIEINETTHSTYDYVTGTLATNVGTLLTNVGTLLAGQQDIMERQAGMNETINNIDTQTQALETNISKVITNQEERVYMEVTS